MYTLLLPERAVCFMPAGILARQEIISPSGTGHRGQRFPAADSVNALIVDPSGNLYVGGSFTSAGGVTVNNIAKWNGTSWSAIGGGVNGNVNTLHIDSSGNIYAGGDFTQAGGITVNKIAKWGKK